MFSGDLNESRFNYENLQHGFNFSPVVFPSCISACVLLFMKHFVAEKISPKLNFILEVFDVTKLVVAVLMAGSSGCRWW